MLNSGDRDGPRDRSVADRRAFIKRWAEYVRTHDDEEWSRQQNTLIDSQLETANEMARRGDTDPVEFVDRRDRRQSTSEE